MKDTVLFWFRRDLRLADNPALIEAAKAGVIVPIFIVDPEDNIGAASKSWLHYSLVSLNKSLDGKLSFYTGNPCEVIAGLVKKKSLTKVFYNRCYEPLQLKRERKLSKDLAELGVEVETFNSSLLWEPWQVTKKDGTNYRVFTPFYRNGCLGHEAPRAPLLKPRKVNFTCAEKAKTIKQLGLISNEKWVDKLISCWDVGEESAKKKINTFIKKSANAYLKGRDFPALNGVSRISPHIHWGEISPHKIWHSLINKSNDKNIDCYLSELGWREFSYSLMYYYPKLQTENLQEKFDKFPWSKSKKLYKAWCEGRTGIPIVDAGMRELWQTGFMHNRLRMITASFLIKNLNIDWRLGEKWFWDCLMDADMASNSAGWQWVAGCGADAAPYFRVFNPVLQSKKFDAAGEYILKYVPELSNLDKKYLHSPWEAPEKVLDAAGIRLGEDYPLPLADLSKSRKEALEMYKSLGK